jgi:hypothetical protein
MFYLFLAVYLLILTYALQSRILREELPEVILSEELPEVFIEPLHVFLAITGAYTC